MKKMSKIVSLTMAAALAAASLSMSACADGEEKIEIAVTGGGEDSMQLNTATSGYLNGISALRHLYEGLYKLDANGEIALGQAAVATATGVTFDSRLFDQNGGVSSGYTEDDGR